VASILICGTAINGLMHLPFALQLAFGWTRLSFFKTLIAVILLVPLIIYLTMRYGVTGAAFAWLVLNLGMFFFEIPIMHRRLLQTEKMRWYWQDICVPLMAGLSFAVLWRLFAGEPASQATMVFHLMIISTITLCATAISTPLVRSWLSGQLSGTPWHDE
jgi:O-antigen/teichoic acid export membrane protein